MTDSRKTLIEKIHECLVEQRWGIYLIVFILLLVSKDEIISCYDDIIVLPYLSKIQRIEYLENGGSRVMLLDYCFVGVAVLIFLYFIYLLKIRYVMTMHWVFMNAISFCVYSYFRCYETLWSYSSFQDFPKCYYADLLPLFNVLNILVGLKGYFSNYMKKSKWYKYLTAWFFQKAYPLVWDWFADIYNIVRDIIVAQIKKVYLRIMGTCQVLAGFVKLLNDVVSWVALMWKSSLGWVQIQFNKYKQSKFGRFFSMSGVQLEKQGFVVDEPVENFGVDNLGYRKYANEITNRLLETENKTAFAVGVNGSWGSGKTSFANFMKDALKNNNDVITIDFEPWRSQSSSAIVPDFFEHFKDKIGRYHSGLGSQLNAYAQKLEGGDDSLTISKIIGIIYSLFIGGGSQQDLFQDIDNAIGELNRKIFIFIDDIDRLDPSEILEVLRLVRNAASFQHTFFVLTYDKPYVVNALRAGKIHNEAAYMEKIVQLEVNLPVFGREGLFGKLIVPELANFIKSEGNRYASMNDFENRAKYILMDNLSDCIDSHRAATRLINIIRLDGQLVIDGGGSLFSEFFIDDFVIMCLLKSKYPLVHQYIYFNRKLVFDYHPVFRKTVMIKPILSKGEKMVVEELLHGNMKELLLGKTGLAEVVKLIKLTFQRTNFQDKLIVNKNRFELYYSSVLSVGDFSESHYQTIIESELKSLERILTEIKKIQHSAFHNRLYKLDGWGLKHLEKQLFCAFWISKKWTRSVFDSWNYSKDALALANLVSNYAKEISEERGNPEEEAIRIEKEIEELNSIILHSLDKFEISDRLKCEFINALLISCPSSLKVDELFDCAYSYFIQLAKSDTHKFKYAAYGYASEFVRIAKKDNLSILPYEMLCSIFKDSTFAIEYVIGMLGQFLGWNPENSSNPFLGLFFGTVEEFESIYLNNEIVSQDEFCFFIDFYLYLKDKDFKINEEEMESDSKLIVFWREYQKRCDENDGFGNGFIEMIK